MHSDRWRSRGPGGSGGAGVSCGQSSRHAAGWGQGCQGTRRKTFRSQGGSVVPEGVLQGLQGESPELDLAGWFVPYRVSYKT